MENALDIIVFSCLTLRCFITSLNTQILNPMKHLLIQLMVGSMSMRQRCLSVAAGVVLALVVVFAGSIFPVGSAAVPTGTLKYWQFDDDEGYCNDEDEAPCGYLFACRDECGDDDDCCPSTVTEEVKPICMLGCP